MKINLKDFFYILADLLLIVTVTSCTPYVRYKDKEDTTGVYLVRGRTLIMDLPDDAYSSCTICTPYNHYEDEEKIREGHRMGEVPVMALTYPLDNENSSLSGISSQYIQERESSCSVIRKQRARKRELKQILNQQREEKLKTHKKTTDKELENEKLKKENEQQLREIIELKNKQIELDLGIAKAMLKKKIAVELIIQATGLPKEKIENLTL